MTPTIHTQGNFEASTPCAECGCPIEVSQSSNRKFCGDACKRRYNVAGFITVLKELTFTIGEAAVATGLSPSIIRSRIRSKGVETFKLGHIRIRRSDAMRLAADHGRRAK